MYEPLDATEENAIMMDSITYRCDFSHRMPIYDEYRFCLPCDDVKNFMKLMLCEFPELLSHMLNQHDVIHGLLKEEGHPQCGIVKAVLKAGDICKHSVGRAITDCYKFIYILNKYYPIMQKHVDGIPCEKPEDVLFVKNELRSVLCSHLYISEFLEEFKSRVVEKSFYFLQCGVKTFDAYHRAKDKYHNVPKIAAQNKSRLEKEQAHLKQSIATTAEKNEKRRARLEELTKLLKKRKSEGESYNKKLQSLNVQKKNVDDLQTKTLEKEAEMEKMNKLLGVLKQQLLDVKAASSKEQETRNHEKEAKKARIKELTSIVEDLNSSIHQKESSLGAQRKTSVAVLKADRDRLQELSLVFLNIRLQNATNAVQDYAVQERKKVEELNRYMEMPNLSPEKKAALYECQKKIYLQMSQNMENQKKMDTVYSQYVGLIKSGTVMLSELPAITFNLGEQQPPSS